MTTDRRSPLRRAWEDGDLVAVVHALRADCTVDPATGCWLWTRRRDPHGYGKVTVGHRTMATHRLMAGAVYGPLGSDPVHHRCGVRACCSPMHLQRTTHQDNLAEMLARRAYLRRIAELEAALEGCTCPWGGDPRHPPAGARYV